MSGPRGVDWPALTFRTGKRYELVLFERLTDAERRRLSGLRADPELYGILRPTGGGDLKAVSRDVALLLFTLREPGTLPEFARARLETRQIAALVADGVLEARWEGRFVWGAEALSELAAAGEAGEADGRLARLSRDAVLHTASLEIEDSAALARRLYGYHRMPVSLRWRQRLADPQGVGAFLGAEGGAAGRHLAASWLRRSDGAGGWLTWSRRESAPSSAGDAGSYKLYLSPAVEELPAVFARTVESLTVRRASALKVGGNAWGLLRPDKLIAYFDTFEDLAAAAETLLDRLDGVEVHGVPFTSEIGAGGLLSWGMDPPASPLLGSEGESWRTWICRRLAQALSTAGVQEATRRARFALERLRLDGLDVDHWTPSAHYWRPKAFGGATA